MCGRKNWSKVLSAAIALLLCAEADAQFTPGILANDSYWADGKAEFDIYDAQLMRAGQPRHCEVLHIFTRERIDPQSWARLDDAKSGIQVVRMQQIWSAPLGLYVEQGSVDLLWRIEPAALARAQFAGTDSFGQIIRRVEQSNAGLAFASETYCDGVSSATLSPPPNAVLYDELPLRVRTIDFRQPPADFDIQLGRSFAGLGKSEPPQFAAARVSWRVVEKHFEVIVQHQSGKDRFLLDRDFPFLLREWDAADGSHLKLKRGLKADYWNYGRNGDRERAMKNPMLEHPD